MNCFKSFSVLMLGLLCLASPSCQKADLSEQASPLTEQRMAARNASGFVNGALNLEPLTFCSSKLVPLCAGQYMNAGTVLIQTASNGDTYITYSLTGEWAFKEIHLYAGALSGLIVNGGGNTSPGQYPYKQSFAQSARVQEHTFVINGLDASFVVAAHASVFTFGKVARSETAWGDGCNGLRINRGGNGSWATMIEYTATPCPVTPPPPPPPSDELPLEDSPIGDATAPKTCSNSTYLFFNADRAHLYDSWTDVNGELTDNGSVTVGGFDYSEHEGEALLLQGPDTESRRAFINLATMKLSLTNFELEPALMTEVTVLETWLSTLGKLTPTNLPSTSDARIGSAIDFTHKWINEHPCPDR